MDTRTNNPTNLILLILLSVLCANCQPNRSAAKAAALPRIHNAEIFGVKYGEPVAFQIAASGQKPMLYQAKGPLRGLKLNQKTGQLSGTPSERGVFVITITVSNSVGSNQKIVNFIVGESTELTPPLCCAVRDSVEAQRFEASGLADYGWRATAAKAEPLTDTWRSIEAALATQSPGFVGHWLELGPVELPARANDYALLEAQLSLWALKSAPIRLRTCPQPQDSLALRALQNDVFVAIHQEAGAQPAERVEQRNGIEIWVKPLLDGRRAVGIFNTATRTQVVEVAWSTLGISKHKKVRDVWGGGAPGRFTPTYSRSVRGRSVLLLRLE